MRMEWKIRKERGNLRPTLYYTVSLEDHEKKLGLPPVSILSSIPVPEEPHQDYCYPGLLERRALDGAESNETNTIAESQEYYTLEAPSHKGHSWPRTLRLPWRENNDYPEVEASFLRLREACEKELAAAYASRPMEQEGALQTSASARQGVAPAVLAERLLRFADKKPVRDAG